MGSEPLQKIYKDGDLQIVRSGEGVFLHVEEQIYGLECSVYEPCLYILKGDNIFITIHNAVTLAEICRIAESKDSMMLITGDHYDIQGICMLIRKALALSMKSVDMSYLEGCCFLDYLDKCGAISEETAVALTGSAIENPHALNPFLHSKKICRTNDGRYYIAKKSHM